MTKLAGARFWIALATSLLAAQTASARSYWYTGELRSRVRVQIQEEFSVPKSSHDFEVRLAKFVDYTGPVNRQRIEGYQIVCDPPPDRTAPETDRHGNQFPRLQWAKPPTKIACTVSFVATLTTNLEPLGKISEVPWSSANAKAAGGAYLKATDLVNSDENEIRDLAKRIRTGSKGQIDAIVAVLNYVVDHLEYHVQPKSYSAIDALESGQGNCQNYSHLAAALLHDIGVEARIVNGVSLTHPWRLPLPSGTLTLDGAQGRHAWLEVNVPGLGWLSFDPQQTQFFVSPHLIRQAVGFDSYEAADKFSAMVSRPKLTESIETEFLDDDNTLELHVEGPAPRNFVVAGLVEPAAAAGTRLIDEGPSRSRRHLVLDESTDQKPSAAVPPRVEERRETKRADAAPQPSPKEDAPAPTPPPPAAFPGRAVPPSEPIEPAPKAPKPGEAADRPVAAPAAPGDGEPAGPEPAPPPTPPPASGSPKPPGDVASTGKDSRDARPVTPSPTTQPTFDELVELGLLDLSEDAYQYVTSKDLFAQRFESPTQLQLWDASLSLQKFGGEPDGELWVTLHRDLGGVPSEPGALESVRLKLADLPSDPAFHWVSFSFRHLGAEGRLPAGRYWLALHFSPDAIVNWHSRIGNPYLDPDDTRSRPVAGGAWDNIINIDFNFVVTGLAPSAGR